MSELSARQKAAVLLMSLPPELSAQLFKELGPSETREITQEIASLPPISPALRQSVVEEFLREREVSSGPVERISPTPSRTQQSGGPLAFLRRVAAPELMGLLRHEHAQTVAVVLSCLEGHHASQVMGEMLPVLQGEVARRLAEMERVPPDVMLTLQSILEEKLTLALEQGWPARSGRDTLLEILSQGDRKTEDQILHGMTRHSPALVTEIRHKLCDYEDIRALDDTSLQALLRMTDYRDLVLALKGTPSELVDRICACLVPDVARALRGDVESGASPWKEVQQAQKQIRNILRGLVTLEKINFVPTRVSLHPQPGCSGKIGSR